MQLWVCLAQDPESLRAPLVVFGQSATASRVKLASTRLVSQMIALRLSACKFRKRFYLPAATSPWDWVLPEFGRLVLTVRNWKTKKQKHTGARIIAVVINCYLKRGLGLPVVSNTQTPVFARAQQYHFRGIPPTHTPPPPSPPYYISVSVQVGKIKKADLFKWIINAGNDSIRATFRWVIYYSLGDRQRWSCGARSFLPSLSVCQAERLSLLSLNGRALEP